MLKLLAGAAALAITAYASPSNAATVLLDFSNATCTTSGIYCSLDQTYGDTTGADVSTYTVLASSGVETAPLNLWKGAGYGDLTNIVFAGANSSQYKGEIVLKALAGYQISLLDFDYATYHGSTEVSPFRITDLSGNLISSFSGQGSATHGHAVIDSALSDGVILKWGPDAYNFGLDNIRFDVSPIAGGVPEPASWALMIAGFGGIGAMLRRRRSLALA